MILVHLVLYDIHAEYSDTEMGGLQSPGVNKAAGIHGTVYSHQGLYSKYILFKFLNRRQVGAFH